MLHRDDHVGQAGDIVATAGAFDNAIARIVGDFALEGAVQTDLLGPVDFKVLTETGRAGKATPADLAGGTITITNVGVFGVDAGTPILTPGETAILAFGQVKDTPWVVDGELAVRKACTLSLSFDHRIVDGELGSAVLRDIGSMLTDPLRMLAWS